MQKNVTPGRRKGCPNYSPEFKQQLVAASCEPGISISKLALENGINANLLFKWRQQWREGKLLLGVGVWGAMEPKTNVRVYHRRSVPSSHAFASTLQLHKSASRFISDRS